MANEGPEGVKPYNRPAAGWEALMVTAEAVREQMGASTNARALLQMNQPHGFDCPGCAWPDPKHTSSFEFCENGAKAVTWEATTKRVDLDFFAAHSVSELYAWSDYALEDAGRLTHPLRYDAATDHFVPIAWEDAFARIGAAMQGFDHPDRMEFYTSGRASNESAFVYQLLAREYGTNNFPDCSNMCHEATSVGLPVSIGVGKGTVTLEDFDYADALFCIGHNPGTNHPRMLTTLSECSRRGIPIIAVNPLKERGLERFEAPQNPVEMLTLGSTPLASAYHQVRVGGDTALFKGMMKALFAADRMNLGTGGDGLLDRAFIAEHTIGFEALRADIEATDWDIIERRSGLSRHIIEGMTRVYWESERVIVCYGMGLTQHRHGTENVQQLANLLLLRGNIGRPGAGICPLRGHSNVQGDRTVGITEIPTEKFLARLDAAFGITSPRKHGHNAVEAVAAMRDGTAKGFIGLGGNLAGSDERSGERLPGLPQPRPVGADLHQAQPHCLLTAKQESLILPCLGRTEHDMQATGPQSVTVEDSMSMVHASHGRLKPASPDLRSEIAILAGIAKAALPNSVVDWDGLVADYDRIRDKIEAVFPDFFDFNKRVRVPGGFRLHVGASNQRMGYAGRQGPFHRLPRHRRGQWSGRQPADADHDPQPRSVQYHHLRPQRPLSRHPRAARHRLRPPGRSRRFGARPRRPHRCRRGDRVLAGQTAVAYGIARGSVAAYYPEANRLVGLDDYDRMSGTPSYKSIAVSLRAAA